MSRKASLAVRAAMAVMMIGGLAASDALAERSVWRIYLNGPMVENEQSDGMAMLFGGPQVTSFRHLVTGIEAAASDDEIDGIALVLEMPQIGLTKVEELTRALKKFRAAGKPVYAYFDYCTNTSYALASQADHITVADNSILDVSGFGAELWYYKNMFEKIGIEFDMMQISPYKAGLESFAYDAPSEAFTENLNWLLDGLFETWVGLIADGRGMEPAAVRKIVDMAPLSSEQAKEAGLVDEIATFPDFVQRLKKEFGSEVEIVNRYPKRDGLNLDLDPSNPFAGFQVMTELFQRLSGELDQSETDPGIALIYIEGMIVPGAKDENPFSGGDGMAWSATIRQAIYDAFNDDRVKAIVIRVDSPGGSALASDIMWKAETEVGKTKPVIVSQGSIAGSGGYYVSIPGDVIFTNESTLTASIGVLSGKFVLKNLLNEKLGINTYEFARGAHSDMFNMAHRWDEGERAWMKQFIDETYVKFLDRIKDSRGDRIKGDLEDYAGGRVYTGKQALELGLVDKIGGLTDAMRFAANKANLDDYEVYTFPQKPSVGEVFRILQDLLGDEPRDPYSIPTGSVSLRVPWLKAALPILQEIAPAAHNQLADLITQVKLVEMREPIAVMPTNIQFR